MLHIDSLLLEEFYKENRDFFLNARVQKIQQPTRREIVLHLRNNRETRKLYININPQFYHVCFINGKTEKRRNLQIPKQPPMFCMLLRKHIEGARISNVNIPQFERILELYFENYNELGDKIEECLSIELMGKHSNIVLYNTDNNVIIGCAHNIGEEKSKERELAGGLPYIYPPKQNKKALLKTRFDWFESALSKSVEPLKKLINSKYFSLSQAVIEDLCQKLGIESNKESHKLSQQEMQKLFIGLHELLEKDKVFSVSANFDKFSCIDELELKFRSVNELIDEYFSQNIENNLVKSLKLSLQTKLNKDLKKAQNTYANQKKQLDKQEKINLFKIKGNLLTANSYAINQHQKQIELVDYETGKPITIELDNTKSVIENAQNYFALYNKGKRAIQIADEMSQKTLEDINYLNQLMYDINEANTIDELAEIAEIVEPQTTNNNAKNTKDIQVEKTEIDGFTVYIGKNSKQNDYIYSKISSPEDLWFHVLNTPGSHVVVKNKNKEPKDYTILKIAQIAKRYSTAKKSTKVSVVYTQRKYIKRPNNTKRGFVVYKNETEIVVS